MVVAASIQGRVGAFNGEKEGPMTLYSEGLRRVAGGCAGALVLLVVVFGTGCAETAPDKGAAYVPDQVRALTFRSGACYGTCPVFEYRIDRDGVAVFDGEKFTAVEGERDAPGDRETFQRILATLAPVRPQEGDLTIDREVCRRIATDMITYTVVWDTDTGDQRLSYNTGCADARFQDVKTALAEVRAMLPVGELVGKGR